MTPIFASELMLSQGEIVFVLIVCTLIMFCVIKSQE